MLKSKKLKKSYKFAVKSALPIAVIITLLMGVFLYVSKAFNHYLWLPVFGVIVFFVSFIIIQHRVEHFIYQRVKKIYDDLTILESTTLNEKSVTTDMMTLTQEIDKYARGKKLEIEELKIREQYRREFLGNVSHELKTPLFTIQGYISTLLDGGLNNAQILEKYLKRADKGIERLTYIIKDLDMITKLEVGDLSLEIEPFDIIELIKSTFELLEIKASKKQISLIFDRNYITPIYVNADKERIQQVLTNLIVNSIKYGDFNGTTEISVENLIKNKIIVRVTDNGEGIENSHLLRLFERFYRVDKSGSRKEGGSGLGLAIVKHIVEAHQERIYVESQIGVGSEFSFTLEKVNNGN